MEAILDKTETGAILYDRSILNQISDARFTPEGWPSSRPVQGRLRSGGRGNTTIVSDGERDFVLRHYLRGGLVSRVIRERYLWLAEERNRAFTEWRLLAKLTGMGLPVPRPAAARYRRSGLWYTADLLTVKASGIEALSVRIARRPTNANFWRGIGSGLRCFHDAGVCHADLNAYNAQVDRDDELFLLDFDRGSIRPAGGWKKKNLARLSRSLHKLKRMDPDLRFEPTDWNELMDGYSGPRPVGSR